MTAKFSIQGRPIGAGHPAYVIAEVSANHNQRFEEAEKLVRVAKECGADAVKLQTYTPDTITIRCDSPLFRHGKGSLWDGKTLYDLYGEAYTPWDWQPKLKAIADEIGIALFSSAFDDTAVDFLEGMNVPAYKIASFEIIDLPLVRKMAKTRKPLIISTGMATLSEIEEALHAARTAGATEIALLKCTSAYPAPAEDANLRTIPHMAETFGTVTGLSDHTLGISVPVVAVTLGASVIEKHFTLSRATPGPDSAFSIEPHELRAMIEAIRTAEKAVGKVNYGAFGREEKSMQFRRSLFVVRDVKMGEPLTRDNTRSIRPGHGLAPKHLDDVLGRRATRDIERGTPLAWEHVR